ncbi:MAG: DUF2917 domain-containing protein [Rubrivivax sp.]|nr:DUF2917 domain-containing protein [Rubrivivax sp.]
MNTALIVHQPAAHPVRFPLPRLVATWLRRFAAVWAAKPPAATGLRQIDASATFWVKRPHGRIVSCQTGTLWLTFDREPEDVILEPGQSHRCTKSSALAVHALAAAAFEVA